MLELVFNVAAVTALLSWLSAWTMQGIVLFYQTPEARFEFRHQVGAALSMAILWSLALWTSGYILWGTFHA